MHNITYRIALKSPTCRWKQIPSQTREAIRLAVVDWKYANVVIDSLPRFTHGFESLKVIDLTPLSLFIFLLSRHFIAITFLRHWNFFSHSRFKSLDLSLRYDSLDFFPRSNVFASLLAYHLTLAFPFPNSSNLSFSWSPTFSHCSSFYFHDKLYLYLFCMSSPRVFLTDAVRSFLEVSRFLAVWLFQAHANLN